MGSIGLFYGSSGGVTEGIAHKIAAALNSRGFVVDVINVANTSSKEMEKYDRLIMGTSTWGMGDLQDDWENFLPELEQTDFSGKTVSFFGTGDQDTYCDTFLDGMGILYEKVLDSKVTVVGSWSVDGYTFSESRAVVDGEFIGLALDDDTQPHQTNPRIAAWTELLTEQFSSSV
ncbi:MAG: flavodoxin [Deferribacterales bacterium]